MVVERLWITWLLPIVLIQASEPDIVVHPELAPEDLTCPISGEYPAHAVYIAYPGRPDPPNNYRIFDKESLAKWVRTKTNKKGVDAIPANTKFTWPSTRVEATWAAVKDVPGWIVKQVAAAKINDAEYDDFKIAPIPSVPNRLAKMNDAAWAVDFTHNVFDELFQIPRSWANDCSLSKPRLDTASRDKLQCTLAVDVSGGRLSRDIVKRLADMVFIDMVTFYTGRFFFPMLDPYVSQKQLETWMLDINSLGVRGGLPYPVKNSFQVPYWLNPRLWRALICDMYAVETRRDMLEKFIEANLWIFTGRNYEQNAIPQPLKADIKWYVDVFDDAFQDRTLFEVTERNLDGDRHIDRQQRFWDEMVKNWKALASLKVMMITQKHEDRKQTSISAGLLRWMSRRQ